MKAIFLDRDGILNEERGEYTWKVEDFKLVDGIVEVLRTLRDEEYRLIVITNQAGIAKRLYTRDDMHKCHAYFQTQSGNLIDHFYFAPGHPSVSESLARKPDSLLFEKAIARYMLDPKQCWMVGDKERDLIPAKKLGMQTILVSDKDSPFADHRIPNVKDMLPIIS